MQVTNIINCNASPWYCWWTDGVYQCCTCTHWKYHLLLFSMFAMRVKISKSSNQPNLLLLIQGLIPRAKLLLSTGGTFFLGFGPLILITVASFSALYLVSSSMILVSVLIIFFPNPNMLDVFFNIYFSMHCVANMPSAGIRLPNGIHKKF